MDWSRIPSLAALRAFEAAVRCRSFSKAARELNVTHAAIAQHVRSLEGEFSQSLIIRQGRGVAATPEGLLLAERLLTGFTEIVEGVERLRRHGEERPLAISVTPAFAEKWLMPRIGDFWARHPDILLNISPNIELIDLRKDGFDMSIRYGDGDWPGVEAELLTDGDFWVVCRPDLIKDRQVSCLSDVIDLPWVLENHMLGRRGIVEREGVDLETVKLTLLNTSGMVQSAVMAGLGVTVQPRSLVESQVRRGELAKICALSQPGVGYYTVMPLGPRPKGLQTFKNWLQSNLAQDA